MLHNKQRLHGGGTHRGVAAYAASTRGAASTGGNAAKPRPIKRRAPIALALVMVAILSVFGIFGVTAFAANNGSWTTDPDTSGSYSLSAGDEGLQNKIGQVWTDKSVNNNDDGTATVSLSAISSASNLTTTTSQPLDIVLVLDTSGSMQGSKLSNLKTAANDFIDKTVAANANLSQDEQTRLSIVRFASGSSILQNLNYVTSGNAQQYKNSINGLSANGATYADYAFDSAQSVLNGSRDGVQQVVIFFTDGEPNHQNGFDNKVAADTVNKAHDMKQNGVIIYAIGVMDNANPSVTDDDGFNEYMNGVSSNYPDAVASGSNGFFGIGSYYNTTFGNRAEGNYYKAASDPNTISSIFEEIYSEITSSTDLAQPITGDLVFTDELGEYVEVSGAPTITIGEQDYNATSSEGDTYTFSVPVNYVAQQNSDNSRATATVTVKVENGTVTATIPAEALPLDVFNVSGGTTTQTHKANPIKINFSVEVSEGVLSANGVAVDLTKIDDEYGYIDGDGKVTFYTNSWGDKNDGETKAKFTPAPENSYYSDSYSSTTAKTENKTNTAKNVSSESIARGVVTVALGNNGKITIDSLKPVTIGGDDFDQSMGVKKTVTGAATDADFSFTAVFNADKSAAAATGDVAAGTSDGFSCEDSALNTSISEDFSTGDTKIASFGQITFKKAGVYVFDVTEDNATGEVPSGWSYDKGTKTITVTVTDNGEGKLVASVEDSNPTFTNSYEAGKVTIGGDSGTTGIQATKNLSGRNWKKGDSFTFTLTAKNNAPMPEGADDGSITATVTNESEPKTVDFGAITYDKAGTYTYTITEVKGEIGGVTYDNTTYTVTVEVTDDGEGQLKASVSYAKDGKTVEGATPATFTNTYEADGTSVGGEGDEYSIDVAKVLKGRDWQEGDEFTFTLRADDGTPTPEYKTVTISYNEDGNYTASFGEITYNAAGEYKYTITENQPEEGEGLGGVTYDTSKHTVTVTIADNNEGSLYVKSVVYSDGDEATAATFTNVYRAGGEVKPSTGDAEVELTKVLEGRDWTEDDEFTFVITADEGTSRDTLPEQTTVTVGKPVEGDSNTFNFGSFTFTQTGTYTYTITESNAGETIDGITYSNNQAKVMITVTDNLQGGYAAAVTITNATFTNVYSSELDYAGETNGGLNIVKTVEGAKSMGEFTFNVKPANQASADKLGISLEGETRTTKAADLENTAIVSVISSDDEVKFTQDDKDATYSYTISEVNAHADGWTYDDTTYTVTITTKDDGKGGIKVTTRVTNGTNGESKEYVYDNTNTEHDTAVVPFTNTYNAEGTLGSDAEGAVKIEATKTLVNGELEAGDFTFKVTGVNGARVTSGTNDADGNITFDSVKYTSAQLVEDSENGVANYDLGTNTYSYTYTVAEDTSDLPAGVSANTSSFQITVNVTDNGNGSLTISVDYPESSDGSLAFTNTYATVEDGAATLTPAGAKVLDYADGLTPESIEGKFTFELEAVTNGAPMPEQTTVTNDAQGNVTFGEITYTIENVWGDNSDETGVVENGEETLVAKRSKEFTYKVTETGSAYGVTNDVETSKTFTVTVTDNGDGTVSVSTNPASGPLFTFTNTYSVMHEDSSPTGDGGLSITKELNGRDMTEGEFSFALVGQSGTASEGMSLTATNADDGTVSFGTLTFNTPGTYAFDLYEVAGNADGVSYDPARYVVTATVTDNGDGNLSVAWSMVDTNGNQINAVTFENSYSAKSTSVVLGGTKVLDGRSLKAGEFSFVLKDADGNEIQTVTNDAAGSFTFNAITYVEAGTYTYTLSEVQGSLSGVTYDKTVYTVTVTVTDNGQGQLEASVSYAIGEEPATSAVFANTYSGKPSVPSQPTDPEKPVEPTDPTEPTDPNPNDPDGGAWVTITKTIAGRDLVGGEFQFVLSGIDGTNSEGMSSTGTNTADGSVDLGEGVVFSEEGTYRFTISEVSGSLGGVDYDGSVYYAVATVTDNGDGTLSVDWQVTDAQGNPIDQIVFENTYTAAQTSVTLGATKVLDGRELAEGEFTFQLVGADGTVVSTATNAADGSVTFGELTFTKAGVYEYSIVEVAGSLEGVTYDTTVHYVTVTVTDDGEGQLHATVEYADGAEPVFTNTYAETVVPSEPTEPSEPAKPTTPTKPSGSTGTKIPETGDTSMVLPTALGLAGVVVIGCALALRRRMAKR